MVAWPRVPLQTTADADRLGGRRASRPAVWFWATGNGFTAAPGFYERRSFSWSQHEAAGLRDEEASAAVAAGL